jgi:hypothetical protein
MPMPRKEPVRAWQTRDVGIDKLIRLSRAFRPPNLHPMAYSPVIEAATYCGLLMLSLPRPATLSRGRYNLQDRVATNVSTQRVDVNT